MSRFTIDQRTPLAGPQAERLPESARKPVRKLNHNAYKSPAYGVTKTSPLREGGNYSTSRINSNDAKALERMFPRKRARVLKALESQGLLDVVEVRAIVQPRIFTLDRATGNSRTNY